MDPLEGSTLDLIYRRRVSTFYPGYTIILIIVGIVVALPLVKVDVLSTCGGMIRPAQEPVELFPSITGIVDSTLLADHLPVSKGDTLVWIRKNILETRIGELVERTDRNSLFIRDIEAILRGGRPWETSRYIQSFRNYSTSGERFRLRKTFLHDEYYAAGRLHNEQVIPLREFEQARSEYMVACAQLDDHLENYRSRLEDDLHRLSLENRQYRGEVAEIRASLQNYTILAPSTGILNQCRGIKGGSVIQPGISLGSISPEGAVAADCFVETRDIREIRIGMTVRIRLDGKRLGPDDRLETKVSRIDPDAMLMNGRPVYRVRCLIESPQELIPGMTFSASMLLYRASLASLITEKLNRHFNPAVSRDQTIGL
ncbi:MAG: HlyD family efflux transporter periplasmic adaptor subunit [Bacteroidetes bacterium]|nr:HlyD family efflux transporter periplasmic adaptor subunit [Bacteroidota bacterium]